MKLTDAEILLLERARACALEVRAYPRLDILKACQLISLDIDLLSSEMLEIFIRSLPQAFGRQVIIHRPETQELSWDEKWLLSIIEAVSRADYDSVHFLIETVVKRKHRREFMTIAHELWKISA
tara:strand:- start:113 stop:484 length:372 start_codon:yes stop_codon:yes gene_type:complete